MQLFHEVLDSGADRGVNTPFDGESLVGHLGHISVAGSAHEDRAAEGPIAWIITLDLVSFYHTLFLKGEWKRTHIPPDPSSRVDDPWRPSDYSDTSR